MSVVPDPGTGLAKTVLGLSVAMIVTIDITDLTTRDDGHYRDADINVESHYHNNGVLVTPDRVVKGQAALRR